MLQGYSAFPLASSIRLAISEGGGLHGSRKRSLARFGELAAENHPHRCRHPSQGLKGTWVFQEDFKSGTLLLGGFREFQDGGALGLGFNEV